MRQVISAGTAIFVSDTPAMTPVATSVTSAVLATANSDRCHLTVFNDSAVTLYLAWGPTATTGTYTAKIPSQGMYELPPQRLPYVGVVSGILASGTGTAQVTVAI